MGDLARAFHWPPAVFWSMTPAECGAVLFATASARPPRWEDFAEIDARYGAPSGSIVATKE